MLRRIASLSPLIRSSSRSSFLNEADCSQRIAEVINAGILASENFGTFIKEKNPFISFVLGGPGSGKGTQCAKVVETFGFTHLSAGDLLREEISSNRENRAMILDTIKEGKIVPSEVTVKLIKKAIKSRENHKFLIDGFPRTEENRLAYERIIGVDPNVVLFFDCPEEEMVKRVLSRNQGRVDDNEYTIKKRLQVFWDLNLPVINYYSKRGLLRTINATGSEDQIYEQVRQIFYAYEPML
ncbi:Probable UMP-CMP kinase 2 [Dionaea muscipula]